MKVCLQVYYLFAPLCLNSLWVFPCTKRALQTRLPPVLLEKWSELIWMIRLLVYQAKIKCIQIKIPKKEVALLVYNMGGQNGSFNDLENGNIPQIFHSSNIVCR